MSKFVEPLNDHGPTGVSAFARTVAALSIAVVLSCMVVSAASAETRTLRMYYTHTKESITVTFKKNGKYVPSGLRKLNRFLRDFRRNEPTKMDPALFDLVWEVYKKSGSRKPIQVISGYRSPRTNNMLRRRGRKVAKNSMHTRGKALDFFMPDVKITKLQELGLKAHGGGVGYYRGSFVHLDTGRVRHWPRVSRKRLARIFPKGRTIHVPSDGRPLKGYKVAEANLKRGRNYDGSRRGAGSRPGIVASLFTRKEADDDDTTEVAAPRARPKATRPAAKPKTPSGPDPFAMEVAARKAAPKPAPQEETEEEIVVAAVTVPSRRPQLESRDIVLPPAAAPAAIPVPVPSANTATTAQGALAAVDRSILPSGLNRSGASPAAVLRPSAELGETQLALVSPTAPATTLSSGSLSTGDVEGLKSRIKDALTRQRSLSAAQKSLEDSQNDRLAQQIARIPVPAAAPSRPSESRPSDMRSAIEPERVLAALDPPRDDAVTAPTLRPRQPVTEVATPTAAPAATSIPVASAAASMTPELKLGNLESDPVKKWAIATSTRVGPIAALTAPSYDSVSRLSAPISVHSNGFTTGAAPLRADRFTGTAYARVAFANFATN